MSRRRFFGVGFWIVFALCILGHLALALGSWSMATGNTARPMPGNARADQLFAAASFPLGPIFASSQFGLLHFEELMIANSVLWAFAISCLFTFVGRRLIAMIRT